MEKYFVPYDIAKSLKEIGFDDNCIGFFRIPVKSLYFEFTKDPIRNSVLSQVYVDAYTTPTYDQVIDWLENKNMFLQPHLVAQLDWSEGWGYELTYSDINRETVNTDESESFSDRRGALNDGILKAIELIRKKKVS